jgi:predicted DNA-binding transcriptional regulator AlpA
MGLSGIYDENNSNLTGDFSLLFSVLIMRTDSATIDSLLLLRYPDLTARKIVSTRKTLREWMNREVDPFPQPVILAEGTPIQGRINTNPRFAGRKVAWRAVDVEDWISRRQKRR